MLDFRNFWNTFWMQSSATETPSKLGSVCFIKVWLLKTVFVCVGGGGVGVCVCVCVFLFCFLFVFVLFVCFLFCFVLFCFCQKAHNFV